MVGMSDGEGPWGIALVPNPGHRSCPCPVTGTALVHRLPCLGPLATAGEGHVLQFLIPGLWPPGLSWWEQVQVPLRDAGRWMLLVMPGEAEGCCASLAPAAVCSGLLSERRFQSRQQ